MKAALTTLFISFALVCMSAEQGQTRHGLADFVGKNLQALDDATQTTFATRFRETAGEGIGTNWNSPKPWLVDRFNSGKSAWLVLLVYPGYEIPDVSFVEAHLFDTRWKRLAKDEFPTGYRMFIREAKVVHEPALDCDVLVIKTVSAGPFIVTQSGKKPAFEQGEFQLQHYAALGTNLHLVCISDDKGHLVRNSYRSERPFKGPAVPTRTVGEWIQSLSSTNGVEVLASLVYLSGAHLPAPEPRAKNVNQEGIEDAKIFEGVIRSDKTKQTLKSLTLSSNTWIADYAKLALQSQPQD